MFPFASSLLTQSYLNNPTTNSLFWLCHSTWCRLSTSCTSISLASTTLYQDTHHHQHNSSKWSSSASSPPSSVRQAVPHSTFPKPHQLTNLLAAVAVAVTAQLRPNNAGASQVGNGQGRQFTTGGCVRNADCQEGCCAGGATSVTGRAAGICSGIGAEFQNGKTGCGFNDPNAQQNIADAKNLAQQQGFKKEKRQI
jgi:hypothetical protein